MRRAALVVLLLPLLGPAQEAQDAETLFRAMEARIRKARSVRLGFDIEAGAAPLKVYLKGTFVFAAGNKSRLEADVAFFGAASKVRIVSDGKKTHVTSSDSAKQMRKNTYVRQAAVLADALARSGLYWAFRGIHKADIKLKKAKVTEVFHVSGFRLGGREKVGQREAQVVTYTVRLDGKDEVRAAVWIDMQTGLPLKRTLALPGEKTARISEIYTGLKLDEPTDPQLFDSSK